MEDCSGLRRMLAIVIAAMVGISIVTVVFIAQEIEPPFSLGADAFSWCVEVGDEYTFSVNVTGGSTNWMANPESISFDWYSDNITIKILELPSIPTIVDNNSFLTSIVSSCKVLCISTTIPDNYSTLLTTLLSYFILPVVDWELIVEMIGDELPVGGACPMNNEWSFDVDYYAGFIDNTLFSLTKIRFINLFPNTGSKSWWGLVNMTTGFVQEAIYRESYPFCTGSSELSLRATLMD